MLFFFLLNEGKLKAFVKVMHSSDNKAIGYYTVYSGARTMHPSASSSSECDLTEAYLPSICPPWLISASALPNDPTAQNYPRGMRVIA